MKPRAKYHLQKPSLDYLLLSAGPQVLKLFTVSQNSNIRWFQPIIETFLGLWERLHIQAKTLTENCEIQQGTDVYSYSSRTPSWSRSSVPWPHSILGASVHHWGRIHSLSNRMTCSVLTSQMKMQANPASLSQLCIHQLAEADLHNCLLNKILAHEYMALSKQPYPSQSTRRTLGPLGQKMPQTQESFLATEVSCPCT